VGNGGQAVKTALEGHFDLILMDCQMPDMDGYTATQTIREAESQGMLVGRGSRRIPIIALTANAIKGDREQCLDAGMDDYISKPLDPKQLIKLIEANLAKDRSPGIIDSPREAPAENPTSTVEPKSSDAPFDAEGLSKRYGGDSALVRKLITRFLEQFSRDLDTLEKHVSGGDARHIADVAHGLKGAAAYLSCERVQQIARQLEEMGHEQDLTPASQCLLELKLEMERCLAWGTLWLAEDATDADLPSGGLSEVAHAHTDR
jgi:CheY-like chemotaxis protein/HPt (histidine-containing phosphotransfer) domain-containing protein